MALSKFAQVQYWFEEGGGGDPNSHLTLSKIVEPLGDSIRDNLKRQFLMANNFYRVTRDTGQFSTQLFVPTCYNFFH